MAIIDATTENLELAAGQASSRPVEALGVFRRPTATTGWRSWLFTVDHKKIGIMYGAAALFFFIVGGVRGAADPLQLRPPERHAARRPRPTTRSSRCTAPRWSSSFVMPMAAAFANYLMPLQIGARDVAFPRINAFSFWCFLFGGLFLNLVVVPRRRADGGWFNYAPNTGVIFSPTPRHRLLGPRPA